ncbi:hypothetical protein [Spirosoma aerophilum]
MKQLLYILVALLCLNCTKSIYHVASVESEQVKLVDNDFVYENEQLAVVYNFWEEGGRMRFLLHNKTDQPIYIDWSKSSVERNGVTTMYSQLPQPKSRFADTARYTYRSEKVEPYRLTAQGTTLTEIPPERYVAIADFPIQHTIQPVDANTKVFSYTKSNSPLRLRQQLVYSFDKSLTNGQRIDNTFWVDKISLLRHGELMKAYGSLQKGQPGALYAIEKRPAPGGTIALVVATTAALAGVVLVALSQLTFTVGGI